MYFSGKNYKQTAAVCSLTSMYIESTDQDFLIAGNNDGVITIWVLLVEKDEKAKPCLNGFPIDNCNNPYDNKNTVNIQ